MVGFTAATFCRGAPVIYLPTSLLAMADAAIGGKTGVNTPQGKNLIGSFTQPHAIFADLDTLSTLPDIEYQHGWAEVIKHALISSATLFDQLTNAYDKIQQKDPQTLTEILQTSYHIKTHIIQQDHKDHGIRQLLNLGHTVAHALECATDYTLPHGQAVAIGIALESQYAVKQGFLSEHALDRIMGILQQYQLPTTSPIPVSELYPLMQRDKKSKANQPYFIALSDIGRPYLGGEGGCLQRFEGVGYSG
jgi:3-dehydroquinate synthase